MSEINLDLLLRGYGLSVLADGFDETVLSAAKQQLLELIEKELPKDREESYYHQNHWKANVYNEGIQGCKQAIREALK